MELHSPRAQDAARSENGPAGHTPAIAVPSQQGSGLLRTVSALRHRNYRLYWFGQLISLMGTYMQTTGQAWLVLVLTRSALQLGLVGALQYLPVLLFSVFGGVYADRWPKRRVLLITQSAAMIQAFVLWILIATGTVQIWHIYVLAMLLGLTTSLDQPTRSAFVVELVGREDLPNAVALSSSLANLARIVGPGLAGIIIAASQSVAPLFLLNGLSFLAVIAALALMRSRELHAQAAQHPNVEGRKRQNTWQSLREGIAYVWNTPAVLLVIVVVGLVLLFAANYTVVLPLFATDVLHQGANGFGFLSAALGIGSLVSALWLAWRSLQPTIPRVLAGTLAFGVLEALFAVSHIYFLSIALIAGVGFAETAFGAMATTTLQTIPPDHLRGRVASVYILFFTGSIPPGYLLSGWVSGAFGPSVGLLICMLLCFLTVGAGWLWWRATRQAAM